MERLALRCDGCLTYYHTDCVALDTVPEFAWLCYHCQNTTNNRHWARAWESIWTEQDDAEIGRSDGSGIWDQRIAIAEAQGVLSFFQDTFPYALHTSRRREIPWEEPVEETEEQKTAWQAMEQFTAAEQDEANTTTIPTPPRAESPERTEEEQPKRKFKRPRTRPNSCFEHPPEKRTRVEELPAVLTNSDANEAPGPSVFQKMLEKVESAASPMLSAVPFSIHGPQHQDTGGDSGPASPASSTGWSNHHHSTLRASSSSPGPSRHSPNLHSPAYSPSYAMSPSISGPASPGSYFSLQRSTSPQQHLRRPETGTPRTSVGPKATATASSSSQHSAKNLPLEIKEEVQKIVRTCLKRYYQEGKVNTDRFIEINKTVSRSLYSKVPELGIPSKNGEESHRRWVEVVEKYVSRAVDRTAMPSNTSTATPSASAS